VIPEDRYCETCGGWLRCDNSPYPKTHDYNAECIEILAKRIIELEKKVKELEEK
jgi:hypothetical protein